MKVDVDKDVEHTSIRISCEGFDFQDDSDSYRNSWGEMVIDWYYCTDSQISLWQLKKMQGRKFCQKQSEENKRDS